MADGGQHYTGSSLDGGLPDWLFWIVFGAIAVFALAGGRRGWRRFRPRSDTVQITATGPVRRGEPVDVAIAIRDGAHTDVRLKVGVFCLERYDVEERGDQGSYRVTREDRAHEEWREISASEAQQGLSFVVPAGAPYSYAGSCLTFEWHAEALELARLRPDAVASCTFEVRP
jgi:hypothetical protein